MDMEAWLNREAGMSVLGAVMVSCIFSRRCITCPVLAAGGGRPRHGFVGVLKHHTQFCCRQPCPCRCPGSSVQQNNIGPLGARPCEDCQVHQSAGQRQPPSCSSLPVAAHLSSMRILPCACCPWQRSDHAWNRCLLVQSTGAGNDQLYVLNLAVAG